MSTIGRKDGRTRRTNRDPNRATEKRKEAAIGPDVVDDERHVDNERHVDDERQAVPNQGLGSTERDGERGSHQENINNNNTDGNHQNEDGPDVASLAQEVKGMKETLRVVLNMLKESDLGKNVNSTSVKRQLHYEDTNNYYESEDSDAGNTSNDGIDEDNLELGTSKIKSHTKYSIKLDRPKYDGKTGLFSVFALKYKQYIKKACVPKHEVADDLLLSLEGDAASWFVLELKCNHAVKQRTWPELEIMFRQKYENLVEQKQYRSQYMNRRQQPGETVKELVTDLDRLAVLSGMETSDSERYSKLMNSLNEYVQGQLIANQSSLTSYEDLLAKSQDLERSSAYYLKFNKQGFGNMG